VVKMNRANRAYHFRIILHRLAAWMEKQNRPMAIVVRDVKKYLSRDADVSDLTLNHPQIGYEMSGGADVYPFKIRFSGKEGWALINGLLKEELNVRRGYIIDDVIRSYYVDICALSWDELRLPSEGLPPKPERKPISMLGTEETLRLNTVKRRRRNIETT
jgi:hypothetical protein